MNLKEGTKQKLFEMITSYGMNFKLANLDAKKDIEKIWMFVREYAEEMCDNQKSIDISTYRENTQDTGNTKSNLILSIHNSPLAIEKE